VEYSNYEFYFKSSKIYMKNNTYVLPTERESGELYYFFKILSDNNCAGGTVAGSPIQLHPLPTAEMKYVKKR
jgi:hypothetical protein